MPVTGRVEASSPYAVAAAARLGLGFCHVPRLIVEDDIRAGRLVPVLHEFETAELGIFIVYPHRERVPAKLRAFIDHLAAWFETERKSGKIC